MYLLWVKRIRLTLVVFILFFFHSARSEEFTAVGRAYFPDTISKIEACEIAQIEAKKSAMSQAGLERGSFNTIDICSEGEKGFKCTMMQESQSYFDGGYVTSEKIVSQKIEVSDQKECVIEAVYDVVKFKSQHDLNFLLSAELNQRKFLNNQELKITGEVSGDAFLTLILYDPINDSMYRLLPNKLEQDVRVNGQFQIPSRQFTEKYDLRVYIPDDSDKDELTEYLILLATKKYFDLLDKTIAADFYKRLDELGRENWRKKNLSYTIYRD